MTRLRAVLSGNPGSICYMDMILILSLKYQVRLWGTGQTAVYRVPVILPGVKLLALSADVSCLHSAEINPYPTAFPYGNGMVLHFYQQQESSTTKTVHKVINKGLKAYV